MVGLGCGLLAAVMTYLITYNEYQHHFKGRRVVQESLKSAGVAFVFFFVLCIVISIVIHKTIK